MTKPKTLDQLRAEKERAETQLAQEQHKLNVNGKPPTTFSRPHFFEIIVCS